VKKSLTDQDKRVRMLQEKEHKTMPEVTIQDLHESGMFVVLCPKHQQPIKAKRVSTGCPQCIKERKERSKKALDGSAKVG